MALLGGAMHTPVVIAKFALGTFERILASQGFDRCVLDVDQRRFLRDGK